METTELVNYLNEYLRINEIEDVSCNGLQIEGKKKIKKIALAVDFCIKSAEEAKNNGADVLIVHHGLIWGGLKSITGAAYRRIKIMIDNCIGLYAAHLPLDMHRETGNNVEIARLLNVNVMGELANRKGNNLGVWGEFEKPIKTDVLLETINEALNTKCTLLNFGEEKIKSIGIVSGGGAFDVNEAIEKRLDAFLTGESSHSVFHNVSEGKINFIHAGHYATETTGLKALGKHLKEKFDIETVWLEIPTGY